jgi:AraC-like DNA-binding protein
MSNMPPVHTELPLDPEMATHWADDPDLDPVDRVHFALDAGFQDPDFTQEEAARLAGMGTRRLRYVLAGNDSNYRIEVDKRRMAHAERLLTETNYLVSAVAELCGYRNTSAFCKRFRETHSGLTPARYRVGIAGRPKRAGGPTGAARRPAERAQARREKVREPSMRRDGWGPGQSAAFDAGWDHGVRQARAFGLLPRQGHVSDEDVNKVRWKKRRRGPGK